MKAIIRKKPPRLTFAHQGFGKCQKGTAAVISGWAGAVSGICLERGFQLTQGGLEI